MFLLQSEELLEHTSNIIHADTQKGKFYVDLTVSEVYRLTEPAALDFGGSEFQPAGTDRLLPEKKESDDEYGWWILDAGVYKFVMNEQLENLEDTMISISPHSHLRDAGLVADTSLRTPGEDLSNLSINVVVPSCGCRVKENARVATLHIWAD